MLVGGVTLYCEIFIVNTQFINVAVGRIIKPGGPRVAEQCFIACTSLYIVDLNKDIDPTGMLSL